MNRCDIVRDLLPLYKDEVVSAASAEMVEEHLESCESCREELAKLRNGAPMRCDPAAGAEVGALRRMKRKLMWRTVLVTCVTVAVTAVLLTNAYFYLRTHGAALAYYDGLISDVRVDAERRVIDVISTVWAEGGSMGSVDINENGATVRLVFLNFTQSVIAKVEDLLGEEFEHPWRVVEPETPPGMDPQDTPDALKTFVPFDQCEIYYVDEALGGRELTQSDFLRLRQEGTLVWRGALE